MENNTADNKKLEELVGMLVEKKIEALNVETDVSRCEEAVSSVVLISSSVN